MVPIYRGDRLSVANKRLLISIVIRVDLYGILCNILLLWLFDKRFRLHQFSDLTVVYRQNALILKVNCMNCRNFADNPGQKYAHVCWTIEVWIFLLYFVDEVEKKKKCRRLSTPLPATSCHLSISPLICYFFCFTSQQKGENITVQSERPGAKYCRQMQKDLFFGSWNSAS